MQVKDLLDATQLGIRLLTSDVDALDRTLRWTYTTDLPNPSRYIAGGELVIRCSRYPRPSRSAR